MIDDDLDDLLGAYALDAVSEDERKQVEAYLTRSPAARAEVQRHHEVAAAIAASPGEAPVPLWLRIEALLDDRSPSEASLTMPELRPATAPLRGWEPAVGARPQVAAPETIPTGSAPSPSPRAQDRRNFFGRRPSNKHGGAFALPARIGIAFGALALVSLSVAVTKLNGTNQSLERQATAAKFEQTKILEAAKAESSRANALAVQLAAASNRDVRLEKLLSSPLTKTVKLTSTSGAVLASVLVGADGKGYLLGGKLPALAKGHTYQLWGVHDPKSGGAQTAKQTVLSLGVFGQHPDSVAFAADSTDSWQTFVLTDEQSPGVVSSKQPAIAAGNVEAA
jgi:anti-sigma factor RsiW